MNATERWMHMFLSELECVKCRSKDNLKLYDYFGHEVIPDFSLDYITRKIAHMDAWCDQCTPSNTMRVRSPARFTHKRDANEIAMIKLRCSTETAFDTYIQSGHYVTKQDVERMYKETHSCQLCHKKKHPLLMVFSTDSGVVHIQRGQTLTDFIQSVEKSSLLCMECHILSTNGITGRPTETITLDTHFWDEFSK